MPTNVKIDFFCSKLPQKVEQTLLTDFYEGLLGGVRSLLRDPVVVLHRPAHQPTQRGRVVRSMSLAVHAVEGLLGLVERICLSRVARVMSEHVYPRYPPCVRKEVKECIARLRRRAFAGEAE